MVCPPSHAPRGSAPEPRDPDETTAGKFHAPEPRREWVPRQRLVQHLAARDAKVILVHAPAGFGKTTAVGQWRAAEQDRVFAWVSLDTGGNDPVRLWSDIVSSVQRACPSVAVDDLLALLRVRAPDISGRVLPSLVDALAGLPERVVLVLDDFHLLWSRRCHEQIESLLASLLPPAKIVIISRTVPPLQVARLRAAGEMAEIGMRELRFTPEEAAGLIGAIAARPLDQRDLAELVEATEGWPAALHLAAVSLRVQRDPTAFVHEFTTRGNRYVADYLLAEVIGRLPEHVVRFLTYTAILDRFTAALCGALTGRADAAEILDMLERDNLFLVGLEESPHWFRYHHLFAQALRARLSSSGPALIRLLHQRASEWFRTQGLPEEAIAHALAAGDTDIAVDLMAGHWYSYVNIGRMETVRRWLEALGEHTIAANPLAAHTAAWVAALSGQPETVQRLLPVIDAGTAQGPLPDGIRSLRSSAALLRATFGFDGIREMREAAATAVSLEDDPASSWHALAQTMYGFSLYLSGEPGPSEALRRAMLSGGADPVIRLAATSGAALIAIAEGRLTEGKALADAALRIVDEGLGGTPQASLAYLAAAAGSAREGRFEEARRELVRALESRRRWLGIGPWPTIEIMFRLATVLHDLGDDAGAAELVTEIDDMLTSLPDGAEAQQTRLELLRQQVDAGSGATGPGATRPGAIGSDGIGFGVRSRAEPAGEGEAVGLTDREMTVLRMLRGTMSATEIAQELELSSNTVKTHTRAIYRKLEVSTRPAAVARARELGLLLLRRG